MGVTSFADDPRGRFQQHFIHSFYECKYQKWKNSVKSSLSFFGLLGSDSIKNVSITLVKWGALYLLTVDFLQHKI